MDYERLIVDNLPLVDSVVRLIGRRHRLSADDQEELAASVRLKLVENEYEVLRKFEGRSKLRTYLITVVQRHFLDDRNARWGKWRPSAPARRLGPIAVLLEQLTTRDHLPFEEAVDIIATRHGDAASREQLQAIMLQLPARSSRHFIGEEALEHHPAPAPDENAVIESLERLRLGDRMERALTAALARLNDDDRLILKLRFCDNVKLARIAELMGVPSKPFYRRVEDLMRVLQTELKAQGINRADVTAIIEHPSSRIGDVLGLYQPEKPRTVRPYNEKDVVPPGSVMERAEWLIASPAVSRPRVWTLQRSRASLMASSISPAAASSPLTLRHVQTATSWWRRS